MVHKSVDHENIDLESICYMDYESRSTSIPHQVTALWLKENIGPQSVQNRRSVGLSRK